MRDYDRVSMSALDQPLLIANSNHHVGHQIAVFVAEEQGFFQAEELPACRYDPRRVNPRAFGERDSG
jgi:hypothetical protein